jgi:hypothetical protein
MMEPLLGLMSMADAMEAERKAMASFIFVFDLI